MEVEKTISTTKKYWSVTDLTGNKVKPTNERFGLWLLKENLCSNNLITNVEDVNYTDGEQALKEVKPITERFCNNIMLVKITDSTDLIEKKVLLQPEICGSFNSYLRGKSSKFNLTGHGVRVKLPQSLEMQ